MTMTLTDDDFTQRVRAAKGADDAPRMRRSGQAGDGKDGPGRFRLRDGDGWTGNWPRHRHHGQDWRLVLSMVGSGMAFVFSVMLLLNMSTADKLSPVTQSIREADRRLGRIEDHAVSTDARLGKVESRLEKVETRLDGVESRLQGVELRLSGMDARLQAMDGRVQGIGEKLDRVIELLARRR